MQDSLEISNLALLWRFGLEHSNAPQGPGEMCLSLQVWTSKPVENLWKNGLFWSRYGFVTHSKDRKPRYWGLARSAYSIKYGKRGNKFGADFRIPETQMELNEIAWFTNLI